MMSSRNAGTGIRINGFRIKGSRLIISKRQVLLTIVLVFLFLGTGIGYVWSNFERTQIGYDISQLKKEELRLKETNRKLRLELAMLKSPQNLEVLATQKLGLRQPTSEQIIVLQ